jgi:hypothetical protein
VEIKRGFSAAALNNIAQGINVQPKYLIIDQANHPTPH